MTSRAGFADEKDSVLGELAVRMRKLSTDGYKQRRGELFQTVLAQHIKIFFKHGNNVGLTHQNVFSSNVPTPIQYIFFQVYCV